MNLEPTVDQGDCFDGDDTLDSDGQVSQLEKENEDLRAQMEALRQLNHKLAKKANKAALLKQKNRELKEELEKKEYEVKQLYKFIKNVRERLATFSEDSEEEL